MKKILIFGCSFTLGSYIPAEWSNRSKHKAPDKIKNYHGWWYFVDYFKNKDVTVVSNSSQGYWSYYQILLYLNEENKLDYDEIWIQETLEPRATINDYQQISHLFSHTYSDASLTLAGGAGVLSNSKIRIIDNFKLIGILWSTALNLQPWSAKDENKKYTFWRSFFNDIVKSCAYNIDKLCNVRNIKGVVWSMFFPIMSCNHFTRLPLQDMRKKLKEKNLLVPGDHGGLHQTEEGNKYIAKLIDKACIDIKI